MEIPPTIPPLHTAGTASTDHASDEKLLKRAGHAARNLSVLAVLATLGAIALLIALVYAKETREVVAVLAATIGFIAAGYWTLAAAARRGNPKAVAIVIVALVLQICLSLVFAGVAAARTNSAFQPPVGGLLIPVLVLIALANSHKVLLELKQRQLWERIFGSAKPSATLCVVGGALLVVGFVGMNVGRSYIGWKVGQEQKIEFQHAKSFVELIQVEEKEFLSAMQIMSSDKARNEVDTALTKLSILEQHFEVLKTDSARSGRLTQILNTYGNALRQWKNGLVLLKDPSSESGRAQKMFELGDRFRHDACQEFDRQYASKRQ